MRQPTDDSLVQSMQHDDELPPSARWQNIPEPPPLLVEPSKPAVTPRRIAMVATALLCTISASFLFLKSNRTTSAPPPALASVSPVERSLPYQAPAMAENVSAVQNSTASTPLPDHPAPAPVTVISNDDRKIDQALRGYTGNPAHDQTGTAQALIHLLPTLTKHGQLEAARHIANLLPDAEIQRVMQLWRNPKTDRDIVEILGSDLTNRDPKIMLPVMLDALRQPSHPFHDRGRQTLQLFLDGDYGNDFAKWEQALKKFVSLQTGAARTGGG